MASLDVPPAPRPSMVEGASPHSSTSKSRTVHSRQISSLSMNTLATTSQSHHPSESLLHGGERTEQPSQHPPRPDPSSQTKDYWERINVRRIRRWGLFQGVLLSIMGSWATYTAARYFIAYRVFPDRRSAALPLAISSVLSVLLVITLAMSFILPYHIIERRPQLRYRSISPHLILQFLLSFFLIAPTVVNLVLVCVWRNDRSGLSLRGRCHWSPDAIWVGVGGQCAPHAPAWGVWLTVAILRLILTVIVLVVYFFASRSYRALRVPVSYRPEDVRRMDPVEISQIPQVNAPSRPSLVVPLVHKTGGFPQRSLSSSRMEAIPERSDTPNREHYERENTGPDSAESSTLSDEEESKQRSAESSGSATTKSLRRTNSSRDMQTASSSSRLAALVSNVGEEELQGFADQFRALVDQVSRELEESRISESQDREPHTPTLHHVLDTHTPYMTVDEFGREVPTEEPIAILGGVIKRMPTIESVGSRELMSLRSATLVSGGGGGGVGAASVAASSSSSRPPTGATMASLNDAASVSLASASQPSSRSNSIHRLRTPSELGELVRDALRARAQTRPLPPSSSARPGSGGSVSGSGSGCTGVGSGSGSGSGSGGSGESAVILGPSASSRSRSNSLGPNEVLPPVTEHGELGHEGSSLPPRRPPRRLGGDVPGVAGGPAGASEMGEISRTELSRSWVSNSATSTTYFTASTAGSLVVSGSGGGGGGGSGGDTGTGSSGGGPQMKT